MNKLFSIIPDKIRDKLPLTADKKQLLQKQTISQQPQKEETSISQQLQQERRDRLNQIKMWIKIFKHSMTRSRSSSN